MKILCVLIAFTQILFGLSTLDSKLYFSENPIEFNPPLVQKKNTIFVPIRTLTDYFDGTIHFSKKTYIYSIDINNTTFKIKPNTTSYQVNSKPASFREKAFMHQTRLYVPLNDILLQLGFNTEQSNGHIYAFTSEKTKQIQGSTIPLNYDKGIKYLAATTIYLPISKITIPIQKIRRNGKVLINVTPILKNLGYSIKFVDNFMLLSKNKITYSFKSGSTSVKISDSQNIFTKELNYTPHIQTKKLYANLPSFLNSLGFDYDQQNNKLVILKKLNKIEFDSTTSLLLNKNSRLNISKFYYLQNPSRAYTNFPYTKCPNNTVAQNHQHIKSISFGQHNTTCRMVIHLKSNKKVAATKVTPTTSAIKFTNFTTKPVAKKTHRPKQTSSLKGKTIIIDPGHGGFDPGAVTKNNDYEKHYTLDISNRIKKLLISKGAKVIMLRSKDINPSLYQRVKKINQSTADLLVSVHVNSFIKSSANGTETYYYKSSDKKAAYYIQKQLVSQLNLKNNGIKRAKMYILRNTSIPGVLIEPCFITNPKEYSLLKTTAFKNKIAFGTVSGIENYFKNI